METLLALQRCLWVVKRMGALALFAGLVYMGSDMSPRTRVLQAYETICMQAKNSRGGIFDYERWDRYLTMYGATYFWGAWLNPVIYLAICFLVGLMGLTIGVSMNGFAAILMGLTGFFIPDILLRYLNKKDNDSMMPQLDMLYSALAIQIRAGVFVTDALAECYGSITHVRLKDALKDLSGEIVMKGDLDAALERFQGKFNNQYIDSLCITILQAMESGQAIELLGDIAEQIKDMEIILQNKKKEQLNRSVTFYQLGIFALILALVLYSCVVHLFSAASFFS